MVNITNHFETPLRKARISLGMTTSEAGQFVHVTRKTWEAYELGESTGKPAPIAAVELFFSKLESQLRHPTERTLQQEERELVVVFRRDPGTGAGVPVDVVADDNFLGLDDERHGERVIKSLAIDRNGKPYVHRTSFNVADNEHVLRFCKRHEPLV